MIDSAWIGYSDKKSEGAWEWVYSGNGATSTYTNWNAGEPNNQGGSEDCATMMKEGVWDDMPCEETRNAFFCGFGKNFYTLNSIII